MGCGASADDGRGNKARLLSLPQKDTQEQRNQRQDCITKNKVDYAWADPGVGPRHVKALPQSEKDAVEKKWHQQQVFDILGHAVELGFNMGSDEVGDLFDKVIGKEDAPFEDFYDMYSKGEVPAVADRWQQDSEFARQKLQGVLPIYIRKVTKENPIPATLPVTDEHCKDFKNWPNDATLESMQEAGKLYIVDYAWNDSIIKEDKSKVSTERNMCAPIMLFFVDDSGVISPACIKLRQENDAPIITSGGLDFVSNRWKVAKILCNSSEGSLHEVSNHLLMTHLAMESVYICLKHTLAVSHPIHELLAAHFWFTLKINQGARDTLMKDADSAVPYVMCMGFEGMVGLLKKGWEEFTMETYNIKDDFKRRDVMDCPDYFYRDDSIRLWDTINHYCSNIIDEFYMNDQDIVEDTELQNFVAMCVDPKFGNMRGSPFKTGKATTKAELVLFCTQIIWAVSGYHAALNNGQYDFFGFVPNAPGVYSISPEEVAKRKAEDKAFELNEVCAGFPKKRKALFQVSFIHVLSLGTDQPIGSFKHDPNYFKDYPNCQKKLTQWQDELSALSRSIQDRNDKLKNEPNKVPYTYLDPIQVACSVAI